MKRFVAAIVCITLAGLCYVFAEVEAVKIGYTIRKQEEAKVLALDRARALKYNIARLKAPHNLERKLLAQKILLESPKSWQTLVLPGAVTRRPQVEHSNQLPFVKFFVGTARAEAKESQAR
jgi:hypothetical protein